ncbi:MAG: ATP-grasp domain-containing protein [Chloroflexota bacterium]
MPFVIFVSPFFSEFNVRAIGAIANLPDVRVGVISQEPQENLAPEMRARLAAHWRVSDALNTAQLTWAAQELSRPIGPIQRLFGGNEQLQVPLAEARAKLGIGGMSVAAALNFRDKSRMKDVLRAADLPCARHRRVTNADDAWAFAVEVGYPLVVKPLAGAASQATFQVSHAEELRDALAQTMPTPNSELIIEEFITGDEHSFDTFSLNGKPVFHSLTRYLPAPLDAMRHPWIQWCVLLPREVEDARYDDIRVAAWRALDALGMTTGVSHLEWFRRRDGSLAISEVAARPPGAQIMTLIARANDFDAVGAWCRLMVLDEFEAPQRKYAVGAAYLRGQGQGRVKAVHGLDVVARAVGHLVTDAKLPTVGQAPSPSYEGEGFIIVRHPETAVVEQALQMIVNTVRVEMG